MNKNESVLGREALKEAIKYGKCKEMPTENEKSQLTHSTNNPFFYHS